MTAQSFKINFKLYKYHFLPLTLTNNRQKQKLCTAFTEFSFWRTTTTTSTFNTISLITTALTASLHCCSCCSVFSLTKNKIGRPFYLFYAESPPFETDRTTNQLTQSRQAAFHSRFFMFIRGSKLQRSDTAAAE